MGLQQCLDRAHLSQGLPEKPLKLFPKVPCRLLVKLKYFYSLLYAHNLGNVWLLRFTYLMLIFCYIVMRRSCSHSFVSSLSRLLLVAWFFSWSIPDIWRRAKLLNANALGGIKPISYNPPKLRLSLARRITLETTETHHPPVQGWQ